MESGGGMSNGGRGERFFFWARGVGEGGENWDVSIENLSLGICYW